jgi:hypothetical protein
MAIGSGRVIGALYTSWLTPAAWCLSNESNKETKTPTNSFDCYGGGTYLVAIERPTRERSADPSLLRQIWRSSPDGFMGCLKRVGVSLLHLGACMAYDLPCHRVANGRYHP